MPLVQIHPQRVQRRRQEILSCPPILSSPILQQELFGFENVSRFDPTAKPLPSLHERSGTSLIDAKLEPVANDEDYQPIGVVRCLYPGGEERLFYELDTPMDNDCALHCLGISRELALQQLVAHAELPEVRELVAPEIIEAFIGCEMPASVTSLPSFDHLHHEYYASEARLEHEVRAANRQLGCSGQTGAALLNLDPSASDVRLDSLRDAFAHQLQVDDALRAFCVSEHVFEAFVYDAIGQPGTWLTYLRSVDGVQSTSSLDALAFVNGINLMIWGSAAEDAEGDDEALMVQRHVFVCDEDAPTVNMKHTAANTHFNLLQPCPFE